MTGTIQKKGKAEQRQGEVGEGGNVSLKNETGLSGPLFLTCYSYFLLPCQKQGVQKYVRVVFYG